MNRRIALAAMALLTTMSFAYADDRYDGIAGSYKEQSGGEMKIRKSYDDKQEPGPWRFVLLSKGNEGDWACSEGQENPGGGKPTVYFIEFAEGPFKGQRYDIVRDKNGKLKELQLVGGRKTSWVRADDDGNLASSIKVGLLKADITKTDSELLSNPGWDQCWVLANPTIKIFATNNVSKSAIDAVAVICDEMVKRLKPGLDGEEDPRKRFNGFKVYITNEELGQSLKQLSGVKDFWTDGTHPMARDVLLGGARKTELWVTEQAICKTGIKTRPLIGLPPDKNTRSFDQVVHEFAHSIDFTFDLQNKDNISTVFNTSIGPREGFAIATQSWFGTPFGKLPSDQNTRLSNIFTSRVSFSPEGYPK